MKNITLLVLISLFVLQLGAVHNFTVNGEESAEIAIGEMIYFEFEFENIGNSADFAFALDIFGQQIPIYEGNYLLFQDGGMLDETGIDGVFAGGFNNFIQLPEGTTLNVTLTDEDVSALVSISFIQLDTEFSIAGNVLQESSWIDLPVPGALVYTLYNGGIEALLELLANFDLEAFLAFIASDHYILSDLTGLLGNYQIFVPEEIPNVVCMTGVYSLLDLEGGFIAPDFQEVSVNGHQTGINFLYALPDGTFYGLVMDEDGIPIADAGFLMTNPNSVIPYIFTSDELGEFAISLADGVYDYIVTALGYEIINDSVEIAGSDVYREIILTATGGGEADFYGYVLNNENAPVVNAEIVIFPATGGSDPLYCWSMADGSFSLTLPADFYTYMVSHAYYQGVTGSFEIAGEDIFAEIVMQPLVNSEEELSLLPGIFCFPNPFNPSTTFSFYLKESSEVNLQIYNLRGQMVRNLLQENMREGEYSCIWDGKSEDGNLAASGVYYYSFSSNGRVSRGSLILIK